MDLKTILDDEYYEIYTNHWKFMDNTYKSNIKKQYHRSKIDSYINIQNIKKHVFKSLGAIPVFIFLTEICSKIKMPGPIFNVEKGILLVELLLNGFSISEMKVYDPNDSFYKVYKSLFIDNIELLDTWIQKMMSNCFSNPGTRLIYSSLYNPKNYEHCTLLLDGRHNKIIVEDIDLDKRDLYSWKLKNNALNTQFIIDSAGYAVFVSESLPCKYNNDDNMFINNIHLNKFFKLTDCLCFDGLYENVLPEVINKYNNVGLQINKSNFCYPIKKEKNVELEEDEANFNKQLGSYRSTIETFFATFSNTFKRFGNRSNTRITKEKTYNIQIKLAILLYNIKHFVEKNNIEEKPYHRLWLEESFDFFNSVDRFNLCENKPKTIYKKEDIQNMRSIQTDAINKILSDGNFRNDIRKNKMQIDDNNDDKNDEKIYEIQYIIRHREVENGYEYEVKWRNYKKQMNSWLHENNFESTEIITNYWNSIN